MSAPPSPSPAAATPICSKLNQESLSTIPLLLLNGTQLEGFSPPPKTLNLLNFNDDVLLEIARYLHIQYNPNYKPKYIGNLRLTCKHLSTLYQPLFWKYVYVPDVQTARLVLRSWIQFPATRELTKEVWSYAPGIGDELFVSTALAFDLGLKRLQIEGDGVLPRDITEELNKFAPDLFELTLSGYSKFEDESFTLMPKFKQLRMLDVSGMTTKPERLFGLEKLEALELKLKVVRDDDDDDDDNHGGGGTEAEKDKNNPLARTLRIVGHYLPTLESLALTWSACNCCSNPTLVKELSAVFEKKGNEALQPLAPNLNELFLNNFQLFSPTSTLLITLLRSLTTSPKLLHLYLYAFGRFSPPTDYEEQWKTLRLPQVQHLYFTSCAPIPSSSHKALLTDNSLRPLIHFLKIFPSLKYLTISDAFDYQPSASNINAEPDEDVTTPIVETRIASASIEERALTHPPLFVLLKLLLKTELLSARFGMISFYRRTSTELEWQMELIHTIL